MQTVSFICKQCPLYIYNYTSMLSLTFYMWHSTCTFTFIPQHTCLHLEEQSMKSACVRMHVEHFPYWRNSMLNFNRYPIPYNRILNRQTTAVQWKAQKINSVDVLYHKIIDDGNIIYFSLLCLFHVNIYCSTYNYVMYIIIYPY